MQNKQTKTKTKETGQVLPTVKEVKKGGMNG